MLPEQTRNPSSGWKIRPAVFSENISGDGLKGVNESTPAASRKHLTFNRSVGVKVTGILNPAMTRATIFA
jgi:hypothetical protein